MNTPRSKRQDVHGWIILDKPIGVTSTLAVSRVKWLFNARKAGHAGTLDPLASGLLPIALGEATKTVPYVQEGLKSYRFSIGWGIETDTDDREGQIVNRSDERPQSADILALLPRFLGVIQQMPPRFSAIRIQGERAYDLARGGETFEIAPREVVIHDLRLVESGPDEAVLETLCGKGTYIRALARDLGRMLGCYGYIAALRRLRVGPFLEDHSIGLEELAETPESLHTALLPLEAGMAELDHISIDRASAARLRCGQSLLLRGKQVPLTQELLYALCDDHAVAVGRIEAGEFVPKRLFNHPVL